MMRAITFIIVGCTLSQAFADGADSFQAVQSLKCRFASGTVTQWNSGTVKTTAARFDEDVIFDNIDLKHGSVRIIGNIGAGDAHVSLSNVGLTFTENEPAVIDVTTVFPIQDKSGNFLVVDTRHVVVSGAAMAEQYFGSCEIWQ